MLIYDIWLRDMPQQFQGKHNIEVLIKAFSRQMQELEKVFQDINTMTDIDAAVGKNLDYVGTIIPLTRKEAGELDGLNAKKPVISDERYRKYLQYMKLRNTSECTYYDIMESIEILWKTDGIRYYEDPSRPATILIGLESLDIDSEIDPADGKSLAIKPSGVALIYTVNYIIILNNIGLERIECNKLRLHYELPFYLVRLFDGNWLLDGSCLMDAKRIFETRIGIKIKGIKVLAKESMVNGNMQIFFYSTIVEDFSTPCTRMCIGINEKNDAECALKIAVSEKSAEESFDSGNVITKRNIWYLDGTYLMDGTRFFNAEEWKENI